jgi:PAS domain S-box-containing protein
MEGESIGISALLALVEGTARAPANGFFAALVRGLSQALPVDDIVVTEQLSATSVRILARLDHGRLSEGSEQSIAGTACEAVLAGEFQHHPAGLSRRYPQVENADSYIGLPLKDTNGGVLGHLCARNGGPMVLDSAQRLLFEAFGASAAAELRRQLLERSARDSEERFRDLFDEAPIAYVHEDLESNFIRANRTAMRVLGVRPDQVKGFRGLSLVPDTVDAKRRAREAFESIGKGTDTSGVVLELRRADNGKPIFMQWWSRPDPSGQFTRTMFVDITERVLMEREQARLQAQNIYLQEEIKSVHNFEEIIGASTGLLRVLEDVQRVAATDTTVLINGETGTGKELIARAIHSTSRRSDKPFIKLNCAALPGSLVESELFGHERGAFSGAVQRRIGRFELAHHGTIFLDEIGEMPLDVQAKLLRVLQEQEFERVGSSHSIKVDVRIIAATNRDLARAVRDGSFRQDLYYRANVFPLSLPPLRERAEDIPLLVKFFAEKYGPRVGRRVESIDPETMQRLVEYPWPGNIRELENLIERALILNDSKTLRVSMEVLGVPATGPVATASPAVRVPAPAAATTTAAAADTPTAVATPHSSLADVQRQHILRVLDASGWVIEGERGAAARLGMKPATLRFRMKKFGICRKS